MSFAGRKVGNYTLINQIGEGSFAEVWRAVHHQLRMNVAIKIIDTSQEGVNIENVHREITHLKLLNHPYVVKLYEVIEIEKIIYIVMEFIPNGTLYQEIQHKGRIPESKTRLYIAQILQAVKYIHENNIMHRDIKAENILVDNMNTIRLNDFGLSNESTLATTVCGTPIYTSPEVILRQEYSEKTDIWNVGVLMYFSLTGYFPFDEESLVRLMQMIVHETLQFGDEIGPSARDLLMKLLAKDQHIRISVDEALKHPWILEDGPVKPVDLDIYKKINKNVIKQLTRFGINEDELLSKLDKGVEDKDTVLYSIATHESILNKLFNTSNGKVILPSLKNNKTNSEVYQLNRRKSIKKLIPRSNAPPMRRILQRTITSRV